MCWSGPLSDSVTVAPRTAPEACTSMAEVRQGGDALDREVDRLLAAGAGRPYVFNLGHGINPDVPPDHVTRLVNRVRGL